MLSRSASRHFTAHTVIESDEACRNESALIAITDDTHSGWQSFVKVCVGDADVW